MIHILTGEYPPIPGGVGDYSALVATQLAAAGEPVRVWTGGRLSTADQQGVTVHRVAGKFSPRDLSRLDRELDRMPAPRRLLVQWTPHSFGFRSLNVPFALWIWKRARHNRDRVELMIHEPFLAFAEGSWRQDCAAVVHRAMIALLLHTANKIWIAIPAWEPRLRPWCFGRPLVFDWLPVPSNIEPVKFSHVPAAQHCVGHFGTFRPDVARLLEPALFEVLKNSDASVLLAGRHSEEFRVRFVFQNSEFASRIKALGTLSSSELAEHLPQCDVLMQPYPDGVSSRRGTAMAALALGIPMVTNLGPLSEDFWSTGGAVEISRSPEASDLARAALRLLHNSAQRRTLGLRARALYADRFHVRHTVAALLGQPLSVATAA